MQQFPTDFVCTAERCRDAVGQPNIDSIRCVCKIRKKTLKLYNINQCFDILKLVQC